MELIEILKEARKRKGYTQEFVAYKLGISSKAYSKIETGINRLNADYLIPLCKILNLPEEKMALMFFGILERKEEEKMRKQNEIIMGNDLIYESIVEAPNIGDENDSASIIFGSNYRKGMSFSNNILLIGGSGTGKSRFYIKPNLLQMNASYIVTDPKGEFLYSIGNAFKVNGYKIKVLNFEDAQKSLKYNPFNYVKCNDDLIEIANCLLNENYDDLFDIPKKIAILFIIYEKDHNVNPNLYHLKEFVKNCNTLEKIYDLINSYDEYKYLKTYELTLLLKSIEIFSNRLCEILPDDVCKVMECDEIDLCSLNKEKTVIFVLPSNTEFKTSEKDNPLVSLFYAQVFSVIKDISFDENSIPIKIFMDEFGIYGLIPNLKGKIKAISSQYVSVSFIVQYIEQFSDYFSYDEIIDTVLFFGGYDPETFKYISELIKNDMNEKIGDVRTNLLNVLEPKDELIIEKQKIMKDKKYNYESHKMYHLTADFDDENAYKI